MSPRPKRSAEVRLNLEMDDLMVSCYHKTLSSYFKILSHYLQDSNFLSMELLGIFRGVNRQYTGGQYAGRQTPEKCSYKDKTPEVISRRVVILVKLLQDKIQ